MWLYVVVFLIGFLIFLLYDWLVYPYFAEKVASKIETDTDWDTTLSENKAKLKSAQLSDDEDSEQDSQCTTPVLKTQFISKMLSVHEESDEEEPEVQIGSTKDQILDEIGQEPKEDVQDQPNQPTPLND